MISKCNVNQLDPNSTEGDRLTPVGYKWTGNLDFFLLLFSHPTINLTSLSDFPFLNGYNDCL